MPVVRGNLRPEDEAKIRRNYTFLLRELDGDFVSDYLYQANVFDINDKQEISCQTTKKRKAEVFVEKLLCSGPRKAYRIFLETLRQHSPHVAEKLEEIPREDDAFNTEELQEALKETKDDSSSSRTIYDEGILNKIRRIFVQYIIPLNILHVFHSYNDNVLTQQDIEVVTCVSTNNGPTLGAAELLNRIVRYKGWFGTLLQVLRDPHIKQGHVADDMWTALGMGDEKSSDKKDSIAVLKTQVFTALVVLREMKNVVSEDGIKCLKFIHQTYWNYPNYRDDIRDWLADHGLPETCMKILREVLTVDNIQEDQTWPVIDYTLIVCGNYSFSGQFSKRLVESGAVQFFTEQIRQQHYINNVHRERERLVVESSTGVLRHIGWKVGKIPEFRDSKTAEVLMTYIKSSSEFIRIKAMLALVYIVEDKEKLADPSDICEQLVSWTRQAADNQETRSYEDDTVIGLSYCLLCLADVDLNKRKIVDAGFLEVALQLLRHKDPVPGEQQNIAFCLEKLAEDESIREAIRQFPGLVLCLEDLKSSPHDKVRRNVNDALKQILQGHT